MAADIRITAEPIDEHRCKFVVSEPLHTGTRRYTSAAEAHESPLASRLFAIPGADITEVTVSGSVITVAKRSPAPWTAVGRVVGGAIREALATGAPLVTERETTGVVDDDVLYERVAQLFESQVNPMVARHGGVVELVDVQDAVVMVRLGGGCQGCGMADVTLRQGIEGMLRRDIPEVQGLVDVTDHTAGSNPYFAAAKK
jgi:NFU1 iron-sulfur cluster scaffold homolog, mitochondrial